MKTNTISFATLGCRLNQAEEEKMRREALLKGFFITTPEAANFCIVNTCSVTHVADQKNRQAIRRLKSDNPELKLIITGCGGEGAKDLPEVDVWIPNEEKSVTIGRVIERYKLEISSAQQVERGRRTRALLKVQDGCNNFCAYCIVPTLRGREVSLNSTEAISEAQKLEKLGYQELVLSGVNVGKYRCPKKGLSLLELIGELLENTGFPRIRLSSVNPQDITEEIIDLWVKEERLARHFHLSLQSGSTSVLKRMGRPYTAKKYFDLSKRIVREIQDVAITTDVIVGFPGETEAEFEETIKFVQAVGFAKLHVFRYSKRTGTRAASMEAQIPAEIKKERSKKLLKVGQELEEAFKKRFIGQEMEVLFEGKKNGRWQGLTSNYIGVGAKSDNRLENQLLKVKIEEFKDNILIGEVI